MRPVLATVLMALLFAVAACGDTAAERVQEDDSVSDEGGTGGSGLVVLTSVDPITDLAQQVLGDRGEASSLVAAGDSHTFEPSPRDAIRMSEADLFLANGLGLNEAAVQLAEANLPEGAPIVTLAELTLGEDEIVVGGPADTDDGETPVGDPNPHTWMNVGYAIDYVGHIREALTEIDPAGESAYRENAARYIGELEALDVAIAEATETIPPENRTLVSYHDSWAYYAPRYGLDHVEAVQPDDFSEPSAAEVRTMVDEINDRSVPAVFGAQEFPSDVLATIADATGATYVADLSDDEFPGEPGDPDHSYIGMMVANARAITDGLGGDSSALDAVDPAR